MSSLPLSIIIPVYNDEKNLSHCLDSVLINNFENFELLLIDDGSTDNCPSICNEYAKNDKRIKVFHKTNEGISKTRQFGIDNAIGDYIFYIDSDDWIEPDFITDAIKFLNDNIFDIIFMNFIKENTAGKKRKIIQKPFSFDNETITRMVLERKILSCLWNVIINRNFYSQTNIIFTEGINYGEDTLFMIEFFLNNPKSGYLDGTYYHHKYNQDSFTRKNQKQRFIERIKFLKQINLLLDKYNRNDLSKNNLFPLYDKFEMLSSGVFSKKEYRELLQIPFSLYYLRNFNILKYFLLALAQTWFYPLAKFLAVSIKQFRNKH